MIVDVAVKVDGRYVENGWTESSSTLDALDLAVRRTREHISTLGLRSPTNIEIRVGEQE